MVVRGTIDDAPLTMHHRRCTIDDAGGHTVTELQKSRVQIDIISAAYHRYYTTMVHSTTHHTTCYAHEPRSLGLQRGSFAGIRGGLHVNGPTALDTGHRAQGRRAGIEESAQISWDRRKTSARLFGVLRGLCEGVALTPSLVIDPRADRSSREWTVWWTETTQRRGWVAHLGG